MNQPHDGVKFTRRCTRLLDWVALLDVPHHAVSGQNTDIKPTTGNQLCFTILPGLTWDSIAILLTRPLTGRRVVHDSK